MKDLSAFLDGAENETAPIVRPISVRYEVTALQHKLGLQHLDPILRLQQPRLLDGSISAFAAVRIDLVLR